MYPVAYKAAAAVYRAGIQSAGSGSAARVVGMMGPFVRGLPVVAAFLFGFESTWALLDALDKEDPGPLPEGFGTVTHSVTVAGGIQPAGWTLECQVAGKPIDDLTGRTSFANNCFDTVVKLKPSTSGTYPAPGNVLSGKYYAVGWWNYDPAHHNWERVAIWWWATAPAVTPYYQQAGTTTEQRIVPGVRSDARAGVLPERSYDGVRAPPAGWPWVWPTPGRAPDSGVPPRVIGDGDTIAGDVSIPKAPPGTRDVIGVTVPAVGAPSVSQARTDTIREIRPANDRKFYNPKWIIVAKIVANAVTESRDLLVALWKALPDKCRGKYRGPHGGHRKARAGEMVNDLKRCMIFNKQAFDWDGYWRRALIEVMANEMQDGLYGLAGQKYKSAVRNLYQLGYYNRPVGLQAGDRFRPVPGEKAFRKQGGDSPKAASRANRSIKYAPRSDDVFHAAASRVVNALW